MQLSFSVHDTSPVMMKTMCSSISASVLQILLFYYEIILLTLHVSPGEWSSPNITGQPPSPCNFFTLTQVGERRAALFGGQSVSNRFLSDLFVVELSRHTVVSVVRKQYCRLGNFCIKVFMLNLC